MVQLLESALGIHNLPLKDARVAVLGYAFREDTDDDRDSPSMYLINELRARGAVPVVHDPHVPAYRGPLETVVSGAHAVVIMVAHRAYRNLDLAALRGLVACPVIIDGRNVINAGTAQQLGFTYSGVGNRA